MKIICLQKNLQKGINIIERIIGRNVTLPILNNILLEAKKGVLKISSTNLEIGLNCQIPAKIEESGELTIPAKIFSGFINNLPDERVFMESSGLFLNLKSSNYKASLNGEDAKNFPIIPKITGDVLFNIDGDILCDGLNRVLMSASVSDNRPEINGVLFRITKGNVIVAATDSFRLAERTIKLNKSTDQSVSFILPLRSAQELVRVAGGGKGVIKSVLGKNQILFSIDNGDAEELNVDMVSRLIDGNFPDYKQLIPDKFKTKIIVGKNDLLNAVKISGIFSGKVNDTKFIISNGKQCVDIISKSSGSGENVSKIKSSISGEDTDIVFNYKYIIDGLSSIDGGNIFIGLNGSSQPALFRSDNDNDFLYIVMPIRNN